MLLLILLLLFLLLLPQILLAYKESQFMPAKKCRRKIVTRRRNRHTEAEECLFWKSIVTVYFSGDVCGSIPPLAQTHRTRNTKETRTYITLLTGVLVPLNEKYSIGKFELLILLFTLTKRPSYEEWPLTVLLLSGPHKFLCTNSSASDVCVRYPIYFFI